MTADEKAKLAVQVIEDFIFNYDFYEVEPGTLDEAEMLTEKAEHEMIADALTDEMLEGYTQEHMQDLQEVAVTVKDFVLKYLELMKKNSDSNTEQQS